ncbi:hypothetical protein GMDG_05070 [Pseudogymnoascus destructans 20631-21]|uniref:Uncharacterized protein n=1 Tax=Pseudogymnoascus destructans (strain ATCC MYA-4855 / 20631-21) TaxID=658429 RepID=L8FN32_PSED2|nr:hypothetical protein GMDG_05070 [Pseudogymnoascus destructans 20631-21]
MVTCRFEEEISKFALEFDRKLIDATNVNRNSGYNYGSAVIVKAGYLVRTATTKGNTLQLSGDFNATTPFEVIGAPKSAKKLTINGQPVAIETCNSTGSWHGLVKYQRPFINIPNLESLQWKSTDALPEIQTNYDGSAWPSADKKKLAQIRVAFYTAELDLHIPNGWEVPLSFTFKKTKSDEKFRAQLYVNGYQFGKYINNVGSQVDFSVPQRILNYQGSNTVALTLWAQQPSGAKLDGLSLTARTPPMPKYAKRAGAY